MRLTKIRIVRQITYVPTNTVLEQAEFEIPEGALMDEYKKLMGDGMARITVSSDMSFKDFGTGAGAMVTVSLSCNQDEETIEKAIGLAGEIARAHCKEHQKLAENEFLANRNQKFGGQGGT